jgi:hypothetical protein
MLQFNKVELKIISSALETIQEARAAIIKKAVIEANYIRATEGYIFAGAFQGSVSR